MDVCIRNGFLSLKVGVLVYLEWIAFAVLMNVLISIDYVALPWLLPIAFARVVAPYPYSYSANAKKQWANKSLLDVYCIELGYYTELYSKHAIKSDKSQLMIVSKICSILFKMVIVCLIRFIGLS